MKHIIFSPCLLYENEDFFDWYNLQNTLEFISDFLDCGLDTYEGSFFHIDSWFSKPRCDVNMASYFSQYIIPLLTNLAEKGNSYRFDDVLDKNKIIIDPSFVITNEEEFCLLLYYICKINHNPLIFVGEPNYDFDKEFLEIYFDKDIFHVPIIKNPWLEKSENFNKYICQCKKKNSEIFVNKNLCIYLDEKMKEIAKENSANSALYKEYGEIVALRNNFSQYNIHDKYINTDYYKSEDEKYIISTDLLHGHFEIFQGTGKQLWINQYNFSGEELPINGKYMSKDKDVDKILKEMRQTHRVHKR